MAVDGFTGTWYADMYGKVLTLNVSEGGIYNMELMDEAPCIAVVSNDFHMYRATHLARAVGYHNPQGLAARDDIRTLPANLVREFFGVVKDVATGNMKLFPVW